MNKTQQTQDFYCAAYLVASGFNVLETSTVDSRTVFSFEDTPDTRELIQKYYNLTGIINPVAYGNAIRNLKSIIHANANLTKPKQQHVKQSTEFTYSLNRG